jgi:hypothetical protein
MNVPKKDTGFVHSVLPDLANDQIEEQNQASAELVKQAKGFKQGLCLRRVSEAKRRRHNSMSCTFVASASLIF